MKKVPSHRKTHPFGGKGGGRGGGGGAVGGKKMSIPKFTDWILTSEFQAKKNLKCAHKKFKSVLKCVYVHRRDGKVHSYPYTFPHTVLI